NAETIGGPAAVNIRRRRVFRLCRLPQSSTNLRRPAAFQPHPGEPRVRPWVPGETRCPHHTNQAEIFIMSVWTTKLRGPALGLTLGAAALIIAVAPVQAAEQRKSSKPENVGVLSGLVIGAAAGGPIGAVVGAVGGAFLGDKFHKKDVQNDELKLSLAKTEGDKQKLMADLATTMAHGEKLSEE